MLFSTEKYDFFSIQKSQDLGFANPGIRDWEKRPGSRDYNPYTVSNETTNRSGMLASYLLNRPWSCNSLEVCTVLSVTWTSQNRQFCLLEANICFWAVSLQGFWLLHSCSSDSGTNRPSKCSWFVLLVFSFLATVTASALLIQITGLTRTRAGEELSYILCHRAVFVCARARLACHFVER